MELEVNLIANILNGDVKSFEDLINIYRKRLFSFLYKLTMSREDSEEILQEVFIKAYNSLYRYDSRYSFSSWIFKIALNTYRTESKKRGKFRSTELLDEITVKMTSSYEYPEMILERKENLKTLIRSLESLKEEQKIAFLLRHLKGYSYKEVGEIMGISPEAVKMKIQRAKSILVKRFEGGKDVK